MIAYLYKHGDLRPRIAFNSILYVFNIYFKIAIFIYILIVLPLGFFWTDSLEGLQLSNCAKTDDEGNAATTISGFVSLANDAMYLGMCPRL